MGDKEAGTPVLELNAEPVSQRRAKAGCYSSQPGRGSAAGTVGTTSP
jgi:hypothetical protein